MRLSHTRRRRVVAIFWKNDPQRPIEIFSNLKILTGAYPQYNYNTLNNYLSKGKTAYENEEVRVERLVVIDKGKQTKRKIPGRDMVMVVRKGNMKDFTESDDVEFWLQQPPEDRIAAVTRLRQAYIEPGQRMDKTAFRIVKRKK